MNHVIMNDDVVDSELTCNGGSCVSSAEFHTLVMQSQSPSQHLVKSQDFSKSFQNKLSVRELGAKKITKNELEILRIIGAISIVMFHYTFRGYAANDMSTLYFPVLGVIFKYGYLGIYLFFILSGYTIASSIQNKSVTAFVSTRFFRLYPSFWVAVCLTSLATLFIGGGRYHVGLSQFLLNLTMLSGYVGVKSVDGTYWFLFVILKFYFLISILLLSGCKRHIEKFCGIWLVCSMITSYYHIPIIGFFIIPQYAPFLVAGIIFFSIKKNGWNFYKQILIFLSVLSSLYIVKLEIPGFNLHYNTELSLYIVFTLILAIFICMYLCCMNNKIIRVPSILIVLGACTYPLYLIHQNIGFMLINKFGYLTSRYIVLFLTLFLMVLISILIAKYIDPVIVKYTKKVLRHLFSVFRFVKGCVFR